MIENLKDFDLETLYQLRNTGEVMTGEDAHTYVLTHDDASSSDFRLLGDASAGSKFDVGKPDWSLISAVELEEIVKVMTVGKAKYGRENWKNVPGGFYRYFAAAYRHLSAHKLYMETGDVSHKFDNESGFSHLAHAACNLVFLMWLGNNDAHTFDDEYPAPEWMGNEFDKIAQELQIKVEKKRCKKPGCNGLCSGKSVGHDNVKHDLRSVMELVNSFEEN